MKEAVGEYVSINELKPHPKNPRQNDHAVREIANSIKRFGFTSPIIANADGTILCGHTRFKAANRLKLQTVPVVYVDLSPVDAELLMIADNKLGEKSDWDNEKLAEMLTSLQEQEAELDILGFEATELDELLGKIAEEESEDFAEDDLDFVYQIMIEDLNEEQQAMLLEQLETQGWKCRALIV